MIEGAEQIAELNVAVMVADMRTAIDDDVPTAVDGPKPDTPNKVDRQPPGIKNGRRDATEQRAN